MGSRSEALGFLSMGQTPDRGHALSNALNQEQGKTKRDVKTQLTLSSYDDGKPVNKQLPTQPVKSGACVHLMNLSPFLSF